MSATPFFFEEPAYRLGFDEAKILGVRIGLDFWIFDDDQIGVMHFGDQGMLGLEMTTLRARDADAGSAFRCATFRNHGREVVPPSTVIVEPLV